MASRNCQYDTQVSIIVKKQYEYSISRLIPHLNYSHIDKKKKQRQRASILIKSYTANHKKWHVERAAIRYDLFTEQFLRNAKKVNEIGIALRFPVHRTLTFALSIICVLVHSLTAYYVYFLLKNRNYIIFWIGLLLIKLKSFDV